MRNWKTHELLTENEYTYNEKLGFVSLNQGLNNDEVLAVAYQYTVNGETYQVGEFSTDGISGTDALVVKLLKPTITNPQIEGFMGSSNENCLCDWGISSESPEFPNGCVVQ